MEASFEYIDWFNHRRLHGELGMVLPTEFEATALFEYLEIFHNRQRRHSSLGMLTPIDFETRRGSATMSTGA